MAYLLPLSSQNKFGLFDLKEGELTLNGQNLSFEKFVSYNRENEKVYILKSKKTDESEIKYLLSEYSSDLSLLNTLKLDMRFGKRKRQYIDLIDFGNQFLILSHLTDIQDDKFTVYIESINKVLLQQQNDLRPLSEIVTKGDISVGAFSVSISSDSTKMLVMSNEINEAKGIENINLQCFNNQMSKLWSKTIPIPYDHELAYSDKIAEATMIRQIIVDNNANVYLIYPTFENSMHLMRKLEIQNAFNLLVLNHASDKSFITPISLKYKYISDIVICPIESPDTLCNLAITGFYSETSTGFMSGTYCISLKGKQLREITTRTFEFEVDFLKNFMSDKKAKKQKELFQYYLKNVIPLDNGEMISVAEQSLSYNLANKEFNQSNNLILTMYDKTGDQKWIKPILKKQGGNTANESYNSVAITTDEPNRKIYLFFNDHPNNLFINDPKKIYSFSHNSSSVFSICPIDFDGRIGRKMLFTNDRKKTIPSPRLSTYTPSGELIILKVGYKYHRLIKINIFGNHEFFKDFMPDDK